MSLWFLRSLSMKSSWCVNNTDIETIHLRWLPRVFRPKRNTNFLRFLRSICLNVVLFKTSNRKHLFWTTVHLFCIKKFFEPISKIMRSLNKKYEHIWTSIFYICCCHWHKSNCENVTFLLENFKNVNHREKI